MRENALTSNRFTAKTVKTGPVLASSKAVQKLKDNLIEDTRPERKDDDK